MKKYFLDTSFLLDLMEEKQKALEVHRKIKGKEVTGTPCLYELSKFVQFDVSDLVRDKEVLRFNHQDAEAAGRIYRELKKKGGLIGEIDITISGMVDNRQLTLITRDRDFKKVEGLNLRLY